VIHHDDVWNEDMDELEWSDCYRTNWGLILAMLIVVAMWTLVGFGIWAAFKYS